MENGSPTINIVRSGVDGLYRKAKSEAADSGKWGVQEDTGSERLRTTGDVTLRGEIGADLEKVFFFLGAH